MRNMRTNYNDSSGRNNGRYPKRQNGGGSGGGRRPSGGSGAGRRSQGQHSGNGAGNISGMTSTRNKYLDMAKEALSNGNRVEAENYYQHAEHYSKMLSAAMATRREREEPNDPSQRSNSNNVGNGSSQQSERPVQTAPLDSALEVIPSDPEPGMA